MWCIVDAVACAAIVTRCPVERESVGSVIDLLEHIGALVSSECQRIHAEVVFLVILVVASREGQTAEQPYQKRK